MEITDEEVEKIIENLRGTCDSLCNALESLNEEYTDDDLTQKQFGRIDEEIFCCDTCGWWFEISDQSEDGERCNECNPEEDG